MEIKQHFEQARELAIAAHGDQKYGEKPYEHHLQAVVDVLIRFGASLNNETTAPLLVAGWLHDSLEDTALTRIEVETRFGSEVAELVWRVTDEPGATRKERKPATYRKTRENQAAIILKLADRIANVEASLASKSGLLRMYQREHAEFKQALKPMSNNDMAEVMWSYLDQLLADGEKPEGRDNA
jgi:(p)ppGpp synthase/HD superfamily hydrolase